MIDLTPARQTPPGRRWLRWPLALASLIAGVAAFNGGGGAIDARAAPAAPTPEGVYAEACANCHGAKLEGGAAPALIGPAFTAKWQGQPDAALFTISHDLMPANAPQSLPVEQSRAILDHIYAANRLTVTGGVIGAAAGIDGSGPTGAAAVASAGAAAAAPITPPVTVRRLAA